MERHLKLLSIERKVRAAQTVKKQRSLFDGLAIRPLKVGARLATFWRYRWRTLWTNVYRKQSNRVTEYYFEKSHQTSLSKQNDHKIK